MKDSMAILILSPVVNAVVGRNYIAIREEKYTIISLSEAQEGELLYTIKAKFPKGADLEVTYITPETVAKAVNEAVVEGRESLFYNRALGTVTPCFHVKLSSNIRKKKQVDIEYKVKKQR